ncbi:MAG TPA: IS5 family transposase [Hanamia sp.]|nr:IS5 family transposase [Hanamia sp.]
MLAKTKNTSQLGFYSTFEEQLNPHHPLYILEGRINWQYFDDSFAKHYSDEGRPAKEIRLMVGLLILKHVRNLSDESVVEQWAENAYYQYFTGEKMFAREEPCEASELVHFRNRIGDEGVELILKESIRINGKDGEEQDATTDTTVQEKNITFPTDNKLHRKIIKKCVAIANREGIELRQTYTRILKKLLMEQRFRNHPKNKGRAKKADRKVKTIAGRLVRELERKLPPDKHQDTLTLFKRILAQTKSDSHKIYSLHEPHVQCISKGKEHKKYEFGSKVSITVTKNTGVIIGAINIEKNVHDSKTLQPAIEQQQRLTGITLKNTFVDRGYRGIKETLGTKIIIPDSPGKSRSNYEKQKLRKGFKRRAAIEPRIGHLKQDHRLSRNYYKGIKGDNRNVMLAAAAMNFKRMINKWKLNPLIFLFYFFQAMFGHFQSKLNPLLFLFRREVLFFLPFKKSAVQFSYPQISKFGF